LGRRTKSSDASNAEDRSKGASEVKKKLYKKEDLIKITDAKTGEVRYGLPRHVPMHGFGDYDIVPSTKIEKK